jgi:hypothetical protein
MFMENLTVKELICSLKTTAIQVTAEFLRKLNITVRNNSFLSPLRNHYNTFSINMYINHKRSFCLFYMLFTVLYKNLYSQHHEQ